jgi:Luciferase
LNFYLDKHRNTTAREGEEFQMSESVSPSERITDEVLSWKGVSAGFGNRGEFAFKVRGREIGHLHGDRVAHFFFARELWNRLMSAGRIRSHPIFPGKEGPAERAIRDNDDVEDVISMMRLNYEAMLARAGQAV